MRTFVAIELPAAVQAGLTPAVAHLRTHLRTCSLDRSVRWVSAEKLHLTLRFLGETSAGQGALVVDGLAGLTRRRAPFHLTIAGFGCFPKMRSPRVVWLGLEGDMGELGQLQADVEEAVQAAGFAPEGRPFSPHLTIGRVQRGITRDDQRRLGDTLKEAGDGAAILLSEQRGTLTFEVQALVHMCSVLKPGGAEYTILQRFPLG